MAWERMRVVAKPNDVDCANRQLHAIEIGACGRPRAVCVGGIHESYTRVRTGVFKRPIVSRLSGFGTGRSLTRALLGSHRDHWIDAYRSPSWNETRQYRNREQ